MKTIIRNLFAGAAVLCSAGASAQDMSNSIEYSQLYIIGPATDAGWDLGKAPQFSLISDGVFEWTGDLVAGQDFKFENTREFHKHIVSSLGNLTVEEGRAYPVDFHCTWTLPGELDCKFQVPESGRYTLTVDLTSMMMKAVRYTPSSERPSAVYLTGSAVGDDAAPQALVDAGVEFKGVVTLRPGSLVMMDTPVRGEGTSYYGPRFPQVDITFGTGFYSPLYATDGSEAAGWSVTVPGDYSIYIDKGANTSSARRYTPAAELFLVGGCCERAWNYWDDSNCRFIPSETDPDVMVWEGELRYGWDSSLNPDGSVKLPDEPSKFKILTARDWSSATYHPYTPDAPAEGESGARISGGDDVKWTISRDGYYRLELNTRTETLRGTWLGDVAGHGASSTAGSSSVSEVTAADTADVTRYYNLQGMPLEAPRSGFCIAVSGTTARKVFVK